TRRRNWIRRCADHRGNRLCLHSSMPRPRRKTRPPARVELVCWESLQEVRAVPAALPHFPPQSYYPAVGRKPGSFHLPVTAVRTPQQKKNWGHIHVQGKSTRQKRPEAGCHLNCHHSGRNAERVRPVTTAGP